MFFSQVSVRHFRIRPAVRVCHRFTNGLALFSPSSVYGEGPEREVSIEYMLAIGR